VVAAVVAAGSEKEAAHRLGLSHSTVKHHLAKARSKVGAATTAQLVWFLAPRLPEPEGHGLLDELEAALPHLAPLARIHRIGATRFREEGDMVWRQAATVILDREGRYLDADDAALELLGVPSVEEFRSMSPAVFAAVPPDPEEQEAWRKAYFASRAEGVLAEGALRRTDGELVRIRTAILEEPDGRFRALFYPIERPTTNLEREALPNRRRPRGMAGGRARARRGRPSQ
jgi:PAS domain-containing protein